MEFEPTTPTLARLRIPNGGGWGRPAGLSSEVGQTLAQSRSGGPELRPIVAEVALERDLAW